MSGDRRFPCPHVDVCNLSRTDSDVMSVCMKARKKYKLNPARITVNYFSFFLGVKRMEHRAPHTLQIDAFMDFNSSALLG